MKALKFITFVFRIETPVFRSHTNLKSFKKALDLGFFVVYYMDVGDTIMKEELMKTLLKSFILVKKSKKSTNNKVITSLDVERINAGNSTSTWGIVFYR